MSTGSVNSVAGSSAQDAATNDGFGKLNMKDFINMLVAEMQHQDPMNPMSNTELLQEVSQIRAIQSNDQLTTTLQSVQLGQALATASGLLNQTITGTGESGNAVTGLVSSATIDNGVAKLQVGDDIVDLANVSKVQPASPGAAGG